MAGWGQAVQYAYRYTRQKFNAFQAFGKFGLQGTTLLPHSVIKPLATYSPWRSDADFRHTFESIHSNTLVDLYRCYDLWALVAEASKLPAGDILEVGVWRGGTGCLIAKRAQLLGMPATVYLCDTFRGVVKAGALDHHYQGGEHADTSEDTVLSLAGRLGLHNLRLLTGIFPDETGHKIADCRFRMCHIDVDVYESGREILNWIWPRLLPGGLVVWDDYGYLSTGGITLLVNERRAAPDLLMVHNLNGHAVFVKL